MGALRCSLSEEMSLRTFIRVAILAGFAGGVQAANAQANFSLVEAYYPLDSSGPFNFNFVPNGPAMNVDFTPTAPAFLVGDSTDFGSGVATIIYTVTTSVPIDGIDLTVQGNVQQWGEVNWTETAEVGALNLGSIDGSWKGSSYSGGVDGAYTQTAHFSFSEPVESFKVKKTFDIDIGPNRPPSQSVASVSLVEQDLDPVPEPCSLIALGLGASTLLARRRAKRLA